MAIKLTGDLMAGWAASIRGLSHSGLRMAVAAISTERDLDELLSTIGRLADILMTIDTTATAMQAVIDEHNGKRLRYRKANDELSE